MVVVAQMAAMVCIVGGLCLSVGVGLSVFADRGPKPWVAYGALLGAGALFVAGAVLMDVPGVIN